MNISRDVAIPEIMQSLRKIFKAIQNYSRQVSKEYGITGPQLWALKTISLSRKMSLGDLDKKNVPAPSTITGLIDVLERKSYVARVRDQRDRRVVKLELTSEGRRSAKRAPSPAQGKMIYGLKKLRKNEIQSVVESVQKLAEIMEAEKFKVTFFFDQE
jgi:DNA-binding MarR family transcriptional regulator